MLIWVNFNAIWHTMVLYGDGLERSCCVPKWWITLAIIVGLGWNFDTIWGLIRGHLLCEILTAYQSYCWSYCDLSVFLTLCQICSHGCTIGTIDTMEFENLNLDMFGLVLAWFDWTWSQNVENTQKNAMVLKGIKWSWKNHIRPYYDHICCIFNENRSNGVERNPRSSPFCHVLAVSSKNGWICRGFDLTDCLWLGIH